MREKSILVVGGSGFVGHSLCQQLKQADMDVINFSFEGNEIEGCVNIFGDVTDKSTVAHIFDQYPIRCVVNLASLLQSASNRNPLRAASVGVVGSLNLLELCREHEVERFIFGSSTAVLRPSFDARQAVDETSPVFASSTYEEIKRFVENMGVRIAKDNSFDFITGRISLVIGPGIPSKTSAYRTDIFNLLLSGGDIHIPFHLEEILPVCHFEDVAAGFVHLVKAPTLQHTIYHLPCESIAAEKMGGLVQRIGNNIQVTFGTHRFANGAPFVEWGRIQAELGANLIPLEQRLLAHKKFLSQKEKK